MKVTFNTSGKVCSPLIVLPYLRPSKTVIDNMQKSWILGRSNTGWMKGSIFYEYITNEFNEWLNSNPAFYLLMDINQTCFYH